MKRMLKPTIISIAMATVMAGAAISPALGLIAAHFSDADPVLIKLVLTVPSLTIIPFSFVSSYLTKKISKRSIVLLGLAIYVISGVGAQFSNTIEVLLARSEEHTSELQSRFELVCRLLLEKKKHNRKCHEGKSRDSSPQTAHSRVVQRGDLRSDPREIRTHTHNETKNMDLNARVGCDTSR